MKPIATSEGRGRIQIYHAEGCETLPTRVIQDPQLGQVVESTWELDGDELVAILQTKQIRLTIVGGQPPVMLQVVEPDE